MKTEVARSAFAVLFGLAIIVPLLNYYRVYPSATLYSEVSAGVFFLCATIFAGVTAPRRLPVHPTFPVFVLGLLAILGIQILMGRYEFLLDWIGWVAYLLIFFVAVFLGQLALIDQVLQTVLVERLVFAFILTALFNAFAQTTQVTGLASNFQPYVMIPGGEHAATYRCAPAGNVAQLNHANALAWLGICSMLYFVAKGRARDSIGAIGVAVLLLSSALTGSRMAWLMAVAVAVLVVAARGALGWSTRRALTIGALMIVGLLLSTLAKGMLTVGQCPNSLERAFGIGQRLDYWVRIDLAQQAIRVWLSHPILGVGVGKFMANAFALEPNLDVQHAIDYFPHNAVLEILTSFGAIGGVILLFCGAAWVIRSWRNRNRSLEHWPMLAGLVIFTIHAMLEMPLWYLYFLIPFGVMLGMMVGAPSSNRMALRLPPRWVFLIAVAAGLPGLAFEIVDHARTERALWLSEIARQPGAGLSAALDRLASATRDLHIFRIAAERELMRFAEIDRPHLSELNAANQRLLRNTPDPLTISRQIMIDALMGNQDQARDLVRRLMAFFPQYYEPLVVEMRKLADAKPGEFGPLASILSHEVARPPRRRT